MSAAGRPREPHGGVRAEPHGGVRAESHGGLRAESHGGLRAEPHGGLRAEPHGGLRAESHGGLRAESHGGGTRGRVPGRLRCDDVSAQLLSFLSFSLSFSGVRLGAGCCCFRSAA